MKKIITTIALILFSGYANAQAVDVSANFAALIEVAQYAAAMIGFLLFGNGLYGIYQSSKGNGYGTTYGKSVLKMLVGTMLVTVPWFYELFKNSLGISSAQSSMTGDGARMILAIDKSLGAVTQGQGFMAYIPDSSVKGILGFVMFIGFVSFLNGIYSIKDIADGNSQQSKMAPFLKIVGGIICMNLLWASCFIAALTGISSLCVGK